jgi:hypothetical protein
MPTVVIVRGQEYAIVPGDPTTGELTQPVEVKPTPPPVDIGRGTRRALGSYMSDLTLGRIPGVKGSHRAVYDDAFALTDVSAQPLTIENASAFSPRLPRSTTGLEAGTKLDDELLRTPGSTDAYIASVIAANSASSARPFGSLARRIAGQDISDAQLRNVGSALTARAARVDGAAGIGFDPHAAVAFAPEQVLAVRAAVSDIDVIGSLMTTLSTAQDPSDPAQTWGQMNAPLVPFVGLNSDAVASAASAIVSVIASAVEAAVLAAKAASTVTSLVLGEMGRKPYGSSTDDSASAMIARSLGVVLTVNPFGQAVAAGAAAFFGLAPSGLPDLSTLTGIIGGDAGFRIVVARAIVRMAVAATVGTVQLLSELDVASAALRTSGLIGIVATFASLGDAVLLASEKKHRTDEFDPIRRASSSPAMYMVPDTLLRELVDVPGMGYAAPGSRASTVIVSDSDRKSRGARISPADLEQFERVMAAEYVPFYFHDIRTNEVIGFHAFITELTDNFAPQWDSTDGFGRVDQVHTYKSTARTLQFAFNIVATSPTDFDEMWTKVNKLVTLVYPQFDGGRWVQSDSNGTDRFVQPFSQAFAASPIIRLRIGDVIRSNYSRFGLGRLFGYGEQGLKFSNTTVNYKKGVDPTMLSSTLASVIGQPGTGYTFYVSQGTFPLFTPASPVMQHAQTFDTSVLASRRSFVATVVQPLSGDVAACSISVNSDEPGLVNPGDQRIYGSEPGPQSYANGIYVIPIAALEPTPATLRKLEQQIAPQGGGSSGTPAVVSFLSPDSNALVKSFNSVGGRGLAGKIDSLSFNMMDRTMWETDVTRCAPMMLRVNVGFTVIHDIAPGLDRLGMNRASVYRVGRGAI